MQNQEPDIFQIIIHGALASIGGVVRVLSENKKYSFWYYFTQMVISSFTGVIIGLTFQSFTNNQQILLAAAGVAGYGGSSILHLLAVNLKNKLKNNLD